MAVFIIAFSNQDLENVWDSLGSLDLLWIGGAFLCWAVYTFFDGMNYFCYLRRQGFRISLARSVGIALVGFYYSNITPGATGGQPMQVNSMRKAGIPVGYGTMAVTVRFITNQFMISALSLTAYLIDREFLTAQLQGAMWVVLAGWLMNFLSVPLVLLAAFKRSWIQALAGWVIRLLERIRIVRDPERMMVKVTDVLDTYHTALHDLLRQPGQIAVQFLMSLVSLMGLMMTPWCVWKALGHSGTPAVHLWAIACLLYISASLAPLPGASGAQEGGFLLYYKGIFKPELIGLGLLIWRFFTFYLYLIVGVFTVIGEKIVVQRETRKRKDDETVTE